jgi:glycyl-tRNA synthetase
LGAHEKFSGKKLRYFDPETKESFVPYVVETSVGLDRMFLAVLSASYKEEMVPSKDGEDEGAERTVLSIPPALAPVKVAILPLVKKDGLPEKAMEIVDMLKLDFNLQYDDKDAVGRRYRRQDAIGTPFCITIDYDTMTDHSVTIRERDSMKQERVPISSLLNIIGEKVNIRTLFQN